MTNSAFEVSVRGIHQTLLSEWIPKLFASADTEVESGVDPTKTVSLREDEGDPPTKTFPSQVQGVVSEERLDKVRLSFREGSSFH